MDAAMELKKTSLVIAITTEAVTEAAATAKTQPLTVVCKTEAQLEHIHVAYTFLHA